MAYVALYRQWRPQNFDTLVGQQPVKQALGNALSSGRIAHAYLFAGPRGTGKTSTARILAKALNCVHGPTASPCGECESCRHITEGTSMDVFEIDAASNRGIDEIKTLRDQLAFAPVEARYKVYIIDEVHMLTTEAFNALLKTLEEPPAHVIFILATTDPHKIPATIHSRCQRFDFRRVTVDEIVQHLAMVAQGSGLTADEDALRLIAVQSEGGMRDALSLLDQCGVMSKAITAVTVREVLGIVGREALRELVRAIGRQDTGATMAQLSRLLEQGKDVRQILTELVEYLRALLLYKSVPDYGEIYLTDMREQLEQLAPLYSSERIMASQERLHDALQELRGTMRARITAELCLLELCRREGNALASLSARLESLEQRLNGGFVPPAAMNYTPVAASVATVAVETTTSVADNNATNAAFAMPAAANDNVTNTDLNTQNVTSDTATQTATNAQTVTSTPATYVTTDRQGVAAKSATNTAQVAHTVTNNASQQAELAKQTAVRRSAGKPALEEYAGDYAAGEDFWKQTLELVRSEKKISMYSCAKEGRVYSFENDVLVVTFKVAFKSERMNRPDFREYFESVLLRLARRPLKLHCEYEGDVAHGGAKTVRPAVSVPQSVRQEPSVAVAVQASAPQEERDVPPSLKKALQAFGGTLSEVQ